MVELLLSPLTLYLQFHVTCVLRGFKNPKHDLLLNAALTWIHTALPAQGLDVERCLDLLLN